MKNTIIFAIRKGAIFVPVVLIAAALVVGAVFAATYAGDARTSRPEKRVTVVLDAGHGGIDAGVTGKSGLKESDFNLDMAFRLKEKMEKEGFFVVLTRENEKGLCPDDEPKFKREDMRKRKEIVQKTSPDLLISIHANKFPSADRRGAQVFFDDFNLSGKELARSVQERFNGLNEKYVGRRFAALGGDYFVLKCTHAPSVIAECGFLSNSEDEKLLCDPGYREELAEAIFDGAVDFLSQREK